MRAYSLAGCWLLPPCLSCKASDKEASGHQGQWLLWRHLPVPHRQPSSMGALRPGIGTVHASAQLSC